MTGALDFLLMNSEVLVFFFEGCVCTIIYPVLFGGAMNGARDDEIFLLNEERFRTPESSKSQGGRFLLFRSLGGDTVGVSEIPFHSQPPFWMYTLED